MVDITDFITVVTRVYVDSATQTDEVSPVEVSIMILVLCIHSDLFVCFQIETCTGDVSTDGISLDESLISAELDTIFENFYKYHSHYFETGNRRSAFMSYVQSFSQAHMSIQVVYPYGVNAIVNLAYFILYHFVSMVDRQRGGNTDDMSLRNGVAYILDNAAIDNFDFLFDYVFGI